MAGILGTGIQDGLLLKPVHYQWAMELYDQAVANTWFPNEIQLGQDLADWKKMTDEETPRADVPHELLQPERTAGKQGTGLWRVPVRQCCRMSLVPRKADVGRSQPLHELSNTCLKPSRSTATRPTRHTSRRQSWRAKKNSRPKYIKRMTEETLDITTTEGKKDFVRNLIAYNIILEGIWFYSGFMVALSVPSAKLAA